MSNKPSKPPRFPTNYGWVTSEGRNYRPRKCDRTVYRRLCEAFMKMDGDFIHLLRSCPDTWIISIVLGHTSVYMNVYDPAVVDDPRAPQRSQSLADATFFEVNRLMEFERLTVERIEQVKHTHPMFYAARDLKPQDIKVLDSMQQALQADVVTTEVTERVTDLLKEIREAEAEEPQINRTPLLAQRQSS